MSNQSCFPQVEALLPPAFSPHESFHCCSFSFHLNQGAEIRIKRKEGKKEGGKKKQGKRGGKRERKCSLIFHFGALATTSPLAVRAEALSSK